LGFAVVVGVEFFFEEGDAEADLLTGLPGEGVAQDKLALLIDRANDFYFLHSGNFLSGEVGSWLIKRHL
jgi:hypothetical protein